MRASSIIMLLHARIDRSDDRVRAVAQVFPREAQNTPPDCSEPIVAAAVSTARLLAGVIRGAVEFKADLELGVGKIDSGDDGAAGADLDLRRWQRYAGGSEHLSEAILQHALRRTFACDSRIEHSPDCPRARPELAELVKSPPDGSDVEEIQSQSGVQYCFELGAAQHHAQV